MFVLVCSCVVVVVFSGVRVVWCCSVCCLVLFRFSCFVFLCLFDRSPVSLCVCIGLLLCCCFFLLLVSFCFVPYVFCFVLLDVVIICYSFFWLIMFAVFCMFGVGVFL